MTANSKVTTNFCGIYRNNLDTSNRVSQMKSQMKHKKELNYFLKTFSRHIKEQHCLVYKKNE
jgi:hypothetical protein